ncbi:MAG: hypothetical protein IJV39_04680 [Ruminococcus sp.]|nr:hypothetical protein [Ruminococcus sp.]
MKTKLFGNNIKPDCSYCSNGSDIQSGYICNERKQIKNGKCRKFKYNPTLRIPETTAQLQKFSKEDFEI